MNLLYDQQLKVLVKGNPLVDVWAALMGASLVVVKVVWMDDWSVVRKVVVLVDYIE